LVTTTGVPPGRGAVGARMFDGRASFAAVAPAATAEASANASADIRTGRLEGESMTAPRSMRDIDG
jgi:hypothetical protein